MGVREMALQPLDEALVVHAARSNHRAFRQLHHLRRNRIRQRLVALPLHALMVPHLQRARTARHEHLCTHRGAVQWCNRDVRQLPVGRGVVREGKAERGALGGLLGGGRHGRRVERDVREVAHAFGEVHACEDGRAGGGEAAGEEKVGAGRCGALYFLPISCGSRDGGRDAGSRQTQTPRRPAERRRRPAGTPAPRHAA